MDGKSLFGTRNNLITVLGSFRVKCSPKKDKLELLWTFGIELVWLLFWMSIRTLVSFLTEKILFFKVKVIDFINLDLSLDNILGSYS